MLQTHRLSVLSLACLHIRLSLCACAAPALPPLPCSLNYAAPLPSSPYPYYMFPRVHVLLRSPYACSSCLPSSLLGCVRVLQVLDDGGALKQAHAAVGVLKEGYLLRDDGKGQAGRRG